MSIQARIDALYAQLDDLQRRRDALFKCGYLASADALQERVWSVERRIDALAVRA